MDDAFEAAAFRLAVGELSPVIETAAGVHHNPSQIASISFEEVDKQKDEALRGTSVPIDTGPPFRGELEFLP